MYYFDTFDICEAYYVYYMLWHSGGLTERDRFALKHGRGSIASQLSRMDFRLSPAIRDEKDLAENGLAIYNALVEKWEK